MQMENRFFDDLARVAGGAFSAMGGVKEEIESRVRERLERLANDMQLVTREEFDAVAAMAAKARSDYEALLSRVTALEARLAQMEARPD
mgnify:CR=1 FL=1